MGNEQLACRSTTCRSDEEVAMKIEIWADFICPFCYIGKRNLEMALKKLHLEGKVDIRLKSFLLDPYRPLYNGQTYLDELAENFGSYERAKELSEHLGYLGKLVGIEFDFNNVKPTNTLAAHRLLKYAKAYGKELELSERLFLSVFHHGEDIGETAVLIEAASEIGLNPHEAKTVLLDETAYRVEVKADLALARKMNISGVPCFTINDELEFVGAQNIEIFEEALLHFMKHG